MNSFCCLRLEKIEKMNQLKLPSSKNTKTTFSNKAPIIIQDINMDIISSKKCKKNNKNSKHKRNVFDNFHHLKNTNIKLINQFLVELSVILILSMIVRNTLEQEEILKGKEIMSFYIILKILCLYLLQLKKAVFLVMSN